MDQEDRKLSVTGLLDPNETVRCTKSVSFSHSNLLQRGARSSPSAHLFFFAHSGETLGRLLDQSFARLGR